MEEPLLWVDEQWELLAQVPCELETIEENLEELYYAIFHEECFAENHAANRAEIDAENVFSQLSNWLKKINPRGYCDQIVAVLNFAKNC